MVVLGGGSVLTLISQMALTRLLQPRGYGLYVYAGAVVTLLSLGGSLGLETALVRFVAAYRVDRDWRRLRGLLAFADRAALAASCALAAVAALVTTALRGRLEPGLAATLWISCALVPLMSLMALRGGALQGLRRIALARLPEAIIRPPAIVAFTLLWIWLTGRFGFAGGSASAPLAMAADVAATALAVVVGSLLLRRSLAGSGGALLGARVMEARSWLRVSLPLLLVSGMRRLLNQTDILLVGALVGTTPAGLYAAASRLSRLITFGHNAGNQIAAPMIAELHRKGELHRLQRLVSLSAWGSTLSAGAFAAAIAAAGKLLLGLFDPSFRTGYAILLVLAAGQVVNAVTGPVGYLLNMTGHQDVNARILAWITALNLVLNLPAILIAGPLGAAVVTSALGALKNGWTWWVVRQRLGINSSVLGALSLGAGRGL
jgi:O-antigen/teichoic acid export membrane protein